MSEKGYTLQALVVTAVLVLMAVAAGVVIVAITRNSSDDLQEQTADIKSLCNAAEIHDTTLAAAGAKGKNGNDRAGNPFQGSAIGCIPVCLWLASGPSQRTIDIQANNLAFYRSIAFEEADINQGTYLFKTPTSVFDSETGGDPITIGENNPDGFTFGGEITEIRVNPDQESCSAYDNQGNQIQTN